MAKFCSDGCCQKSIRDQVIEGLLDGDTVENLLQEKDLTLKTTIAKCIALKRQQTVEQVEVMDEWAEVMDERVEVMDDQVDATDEQVEVGDREHGLVCHQPSLPSAACLHPAPPPPPPIRQDVHWVWL